MNAELHAPPQSLPACASCSTRSRSCETRRAFHRVSCRIPHRLWRLHRRPTSHTAMGLHVTSLVLGMAIAAAALAWPQAWAGLSGVLAAGGLGASTPTPSAAFTGGAADRMAHQFSALARQQRAPAPPGADLAFERSVSAAGGSACGVALTAAWHGPQEHYFAVITDKDHNSVGPEEGHWHSTLRRGRLRLAAGGNYSVEWVGDTTLSTRTATKGRSMELSELVRYRHLLFAVCDSTGMVWKVSLPSGTVLPRYTIAGAQRTAPAAVHRACTRRHRPQMGTGRCPSPSRASGRR